jgi:hypothetical protein
VCLCVRAGRPISHESAGEREYFRGKVHGTCFPPAEPGFIAQEASDLSVGLSRLSLALEIEETRGWKQDEVLPVGDSLGKARATRRSFLSGARQRSTVSKGDRHSQ